VVNPPVVGPPTIKIAGVPGKKCVRRAFKARVNVKGRKPTARVLLDGRQLRRSKLGSFKVRVPVGKLKPGRHRLTVRVTQPGGPKGSRTVRFRRC
jgi:hypothetical protein